MMRKDHEQQDQITFWSRRIARIWSLPLLGYALLLFTGYTWSWITTGTADPHAVEGAPALDALPPILMFLGILGLAVAWRRERIGGAINIMFQFLVIVLLLFTRPITQDFSRYAVPYFLALAAAVPGILFLFASSRSQKPPAAEVS